MKNAIAVLSVAAALLSGCAALQSPPPVRTFRLTYRPPEPSGAAPLPATVRLLPFGIVSAYDSQAFLYRTGRFDVGIDYYDRWVGNPSNMITDLVARDLAAARVVEAVFLEPTAVPIDYELSGYIETLEERDEGGGCTAHLRVRIALIRVPPDGARRVVLQDSLTGDAPCREGDPESYAEAMSTAVQQVSDTIRGHLLDAVLADEPSAGPPR